MRNLITGMGASFVVLLAACSGRVADIPGGGGSSSGGASSGGTSSGGTSSGGTSSGGGSGGGPASCTTDADCGAGNLCGFPEAEGCSSTGSCFPAPGGMCELYAPGCACDGTTINIACTGLPNGYASKPLSHTGECEAPPPLSCTTRADCPPELVCAFPISQGCAAKGTCMMQGPMCNMPSLIGCACDGTDVYYGNCSGIPGGYAPKPLESPGPCTTEIDAGAGD